jgi:deferrochelatase/peroxidase EfeB
MRGLTTTVPDVLTERNLRRNCKLHQRVADFRQYLKANLRVSKLKNCWRQKWGAGVAARLALCPMHDDAELGADPRRNNDPFKADDPAGFKTPSGSHMRRCNRAI